jgi:hypothetical protein
MAGTISAELVLLLLKRQLHDWNTSRHDGATASWPHPPGVLLRTLLLLLLVLLLGARLLLLLACCIVCSCGRLMLPVDAVKPIHLHTHAPQVRKAQQPQIKNPREENTFAGESAHYR